MFIDFVMYNRYTYNLTTKKGYIVKEKIGLVLEGGGLRGIYTSGVLDYFMDENIYFPYVIGVSMGACNAASYVSKQRGRNKIVNTCFLKDKRYISYRGLLKTGSLFGMNFIFDDVPNRLVPFDYQHFVQSEQKFVIGATDCKTGKPVYYHKDECDDILEVIKASSSLPFVSKIVEYEDKELLDGGISDSIPVRKSLVDGNEKVVVVLTRDEGYLKKPVKFKKLVHRRYNQYPNLVEAIINRHQMYNETLELVRELEKQGRALVIRPGRPLKIGRAERNKEKLLALYEYGYNEAKLIERKLKTFINE